MYYRLAARKTLYILYISNAILLRNKCLNRTCALFYRILYHIYIYDDLPHPESTYIIYIRKNSYFFKIYISIFYDN